MDHSNQIRLKKKYNAHFYFLISSFTFFALSIAVNSQDIVTPIEYPQALLVITDNCKLTFINIKNSSDFNVHNYADICHADFYKHLNLYFSSSLSKIESFHEIEYPVLLSTTTDSKKEFLDKKHFYKFSVDFFNRKVYAIAMNKNTKPSHLTVFDIETQNYKILLSNLESPKHIELDPFTGLLFIGQSSSILRANMDGTSMKRIIDNVEVTSLSIDYYTSKMYWIKSYLELWTSNYNGESPKQISSVSPPIKETNVAVLNNLLFYVLTNAENTTVIRTCNVKRKAKCLNNVNPEFSTLFKTKINYMKIYDTESMNLITKSKKNPCELSQCEQLCLLTNDTQGFSCSCKLGYHLKNDSLNCEKTIVNFPRTLSVITEKCKLTVMNINYPRYYIQYDDSDICFFDFFRNQTIYTTSTLSSIKSLVEKETYPDIILPTNFEEESLDMKSFYKFAIDSLNKKIYVIMTEEHIKASYLIVFDIETREYKILLSNLNSPKHIDLDSYSGLLFIGQSSSIATVNMDGTKSKTIIDQSEITSLSVDYFVKKIYWIKSFTELWTSNYDGTNKRIVMLIRSFRLTDVVASNNSLFYILSNSKNLSVIRTCNVQNSGECKNDTDFPTIFNTEIKSIKIYDTESINSILRSKENPCKRSQCEQLCLLTNDTQGFSCSCKLGHSLKNDLFSCKIDDYLLYTEGSYIKSQILDRNHITNELTQSAIYPIRFSTKADIAAFDFDFAGNRIFFVDDAADANTLYAKEIVSPYKQYKINVLHRPANHISVQTLAMTYDWMTKNIYVTTLNKDEKSGNILHYLHIVSVPQKENLPSYKLYQPLKDLKFVSSLVANPAEGCVYFMIKDKTLKCSHVRLNGTKINPYQDSHNIHEPTMDWFRQEVDWFGAYDGSRIVKLIGYKKPISISLRNELAYVNNSTSIWRIHQSFNSNLPPEKLVVSSGLNKIVGTRIFSKATQPIIKDHPCYNNNGGCQQFCFAFLSESSLKKQCSCENSEKRDNKEVNNYKTCS